MSLSRNKLVVISGLIVVIIAAFVLWRFNISSSIAQKIKIYQESRQMAKATNYVFNTLEPKEIAKAIPELEKILQSPSSFDIEVKAKIALALAYFSSNNPNPVKGISLLKEAAANQNYPVYQRARAVQFLVERGDDYNREFAEKYVFTGQPFESFYKEKNLEMAIRRLDEWADMLSPMVTPNYRIARWYADALIINKISPYLSADQKKQYTDHLNERFNKANVLFSRVPTEKIDKDRLLLAYLLRAEILAKLYLLNQDKPDYRIEADSYFSQAWELDKTYFVPRQQGLSVLYRYAAFLASTFNQPDTAKINELLEPIYNASQDKDPTFFNFLKNENNPLFDANSNYDKREIMMVAQVAPKFKELLKNLGWDDKQLNGSFIPLLMVSH